MRVSLLYLFVAWTVLWLLCNLLKASTSGLSSVYDPLNTAKLSRAVFHGIFIKYLLIMIGFCLSLIFTWQQRECFLVFPSQVFTIHLIIGFFFELVNWDSAIYLGLLEIFNSVKSIWSSDHLGKQEKKI